MNSRLDDPSSPPRAAGDTKLFVLIVLPFFVTLVCLLFLASASMEVLSAVRAYVGGEGLWSKGQKEAVYHLIQYANSGAEGHYQNYLASIAVPLGDRVARLELDEAHPDLAVAGEGFLDGRNHRDDIGGMIDLFRLFRHVSFMSEAIDIWAAGDAQIDRLTALAEQLRAEVRTHGPNTAGTAALLEEILTVDAQLTPIEDSFSYTLGRASRITRKLLFGALALATVTMAILGAIFTRTLLRQRGKYQRALLNSEERYRTFFESSIDAVLLSTPDGRILAANREACTLFGYAEHELQALGRPAIVDLVLPDIQVAIDERSHTGRYKGNLRFRKKDGSTFNGEISSSTYSDASGAERASLIVRDITERIAAEAEILRLNATLEERVALRTAELSAANADLLASNRELEAFSYSVSHDLRAPLRGISGFSTILLEDCADTLSHAGKQYLRRIIDASQRMGQLIDDLLNLARVTRKELTPSTVDLSSMADSIAAELAQLHPERQVEVSIAPGLNVDADPVLVRVALENLLANAWKFTHKTSPARIEFGMDEEGVFYVRDNGSGFDMAYADKLFSAFNRLHSEEEFKGTGIGLATVQRVISRHGGRVWARGELGRGATFYFTVPH